MTQDQDSEGDARAQSSRSSAEDQDSQKSIARQRWQRAIRRVIRLTKLKSISEPLPPPFGDPLTRNPAIKWHPWRPCNPDAATSQSPAPFRYVPGQPFQPQTYEVLGRRWDGELVALDHFQKGANKFQEETSAADSRTSEEEITREAAAAETVAENMRRQSFEGGVRGTSREKAEEEHVGAEDDHEEGDDGEHDNDENDDDEVDVEEDDEEEMDVEKEDEEEDDDVEEGEEV